MASITSISGTNISVSASVSNPIQSSVAPSTVTATLPLPTTSSSIIPPSTSTSIVSQSPTSTVVVPPSTSSQPPVVVSSTVLVDPATSGGSTAPAIITVTSTQDAVTYTPSNTTPVSSASSRSASPSILGASSNNGGSGGGLGTSGKIAIAVIIPIVLIAGLFLFGLFLWRKRKAKKSAEEQRKNEMAEYGFNPNNDPDLIPVGAAYTDGGSEGDEGYRGWGTTTSNARKASTTLGSNSKAPNMTYSDTASQPGNYGYQGSPNGQASEHWSGDPLVGGHHEGIDGVAALGGAGMAGGAAAAVSRNNRTSQGGIQRGPSNASSSYSHNPPHSEASSDTPGNIVNYYQEEVPYNIYNDVAPSHGPYGEGNYTTPGADQPVIRDVQARRNTRIERVPTFPQTQGGIAQNF